MPNANTAELTDLERIILHIESRATEHKAPKRKPSSASPA